MREKYETLALAVLKDLAKARGIKITSAMKKAAIQLHMRPETPAGKARMMSFTTFNGRQKST